MYVTEGPCMTNSGGSGMEQNIMAKDWEWDNLEWEWDSLKWEWDILGWEWDNLELECEALTVLSEPEEEVGILKIMLIYDMVDIIRIH